MRRKASFLGVLVAFASVFAVSLQAAVECLCPDNTSAAAFEFAAVQYSDTLAGGEKSVLIDQAGNQAAVPSIATGETINLGGGLLYNARFDASPSGERMTLVIPEPGKIALAASLIAMAFALLGEGEGHESIARIFLRSLLRRMPPNRG